MSGTSGSGGVPLFASNEKVLCFHGPLIYEGRVLKLKQAKDGENSYMIHYLGWSKKWDEYVPESRVLKITEENLKRQKEHAEALAESGGSGSSGGRKSMSKSGGMSGGGGGGRGGGSSGNGNKKSGSIAGDSVVSATNSPVPSPAQPTDEKEIPLPKAGSKHKSSTAPEPSTTKKKRLEAHVESEVKFANKQTVEIIVPERIQTLLVDDYDFIARQKKLLSLPARNSVEKVLNDYLEFVKGKQDNLDPNDRNEPFEEYINGIKDFFNVMLGVQLLYRFERQQYKDVLTDAKRRDPNISENDELESLVTVYGPIHLLRLFTKLGNVLAFTDIEPTMVTIFVKFTEDFMEFMLSKLDEYFSPTDYIVSDPGYQRRAPC